jgi:DNA polymerase (family 10)
MTEAASDYAPFESETALYRALGLDLVAPELREDRGEIEAAAAGQLPALVEAADVPGFLHVHSRFSDGADGILELARAARELGAEWLTITDHSRSAGYAGGLDLTRLRQQWREIERVQRLVPEVVLLRGAEVDILEDGRLDYPDAVLAELDVVVASIHARHRMDEAGMTRRVLAALDNPYVHVLAHPTGRLIGKREPFGLQLEAVAERAARNGVALEVNGNPERLDLSAEHVQLALSKGARIAVSTDAHSARTLVNRRFSLGTARRGWATSADVFDACGVDELRGRLRRRRA